MYFKILSVNTTDASPHSRSSNRICFSSYTFHRSSIGSTLSPESHSLLPLQNIFNLTASPKGHGFVLRFVDALRPYSVPSSAPLSICFGTAGLQFSPVMTPAPSPVLASPVLPSTDGDCRKRVPKACDRCRIKKVKCEKKSRNNASQLGLDLKRVRFC